MAWPFTALLARETHMLYHVYSRYCPGDSNTSAEEMRLIHSVALPSSQEWDIKGMTFCPNERIRGTNLATLFSWTCQESDSRIPQLIVYTPITYSTTDSGYLFSEIRARGRDPFPSRMASCVLSIRIRIGFSTHGQEPPIAPLLWI